MNLKLAKIYLRASLNYIECDKHCTFKNHIVCCYKDCTCPTYEGHITEDQVVEATKFILDYLDKIGEDNR